MENASGAEILAEGSVAVALSLGWGELFRDGPQLRNEGRIEAFSTSPEGMSVAIRSAADDIHSMRIQNSGIIRGEIAYIAAVEGIGAGSPRYGSDRIQNLAGGEIYGRIETRLGTDFVSNAGSIHGNLLMGEGADLVDTVRGRIQGMTQLEWGDDQFRGAAVSDVALGGRNHDRLDGFAGHDLLLGGLGDDRLTGGRGNDGLYGEHGDDRIVSLGGDRVDAGAGDDLIKVADLSFEAIRGGTGFDRLMLDIGADSLDLSAVRSTGRVTGIEMLEMRGDQRLVVRAGDAPGISGGKTLWLVTTATDEVELVGAWREVGTTVLDGRTYRRFALAGEVTMVAGRGEVTVSEAPSAPAGGLDAVADGPAAPLPDASIGAGLSSVKTVLRSKELFGSETVEEYEVWSGRGDWYLAGIYDPDISLVNHGRLLMTGLSDHNMVQVLRVDGDRVENYGLIRATASPGGGATGVSGECWLINHGNIEAIARSGSAIGAAAEGTLFHDVNFENYGTISARTEGGWAMGLMLSDGKEGLNAGDIVAVGGETVVGASLVLQEHFTNTGTITADLAVGAEGTTTGLLYRSGNFGLTFINHGLVRGETAIRGDTFSNRGNASFFNFGRLEGDVDLFDAFNFFENRGVVTGEVRLSEGVDVWTGEHGEQQGSVLGGGGHDVIVGSAATDQLNGDAGDDYLRGGAGADRLTGGTGKDVFVYGAVGDSSGEMIDTILDFESGTDRIDLTGLDIRTISIAHMTGFSYLHVRTGSGTLSVRVEGTLRAADLIRYPADAIEGSADADLLAATEGGSILRGMDGNDVLVGSDGNDRLEGGRGIDAAWGGAGDDTYVIHTPGDVVFEAVDAGIDTILLATSDLLRTPNHVENVTLLLAGFVRGNTLDNVLRGSKGNDSILGGKGDDTLDGRNGDDAIYGGLGADVLTGGDGADVFGFAKVEESLAQPDIITDFTSGADKININGIGLEAFGGILSPFDFIGTAAFSRHAGEVRYEMRDGAAHVFVDIDGDSRADMHIIAVTDHLEATDFLF